MANELCESDSWVSSFSIFLSAWLQQGPSVVVGIPLRSPHKLFVCTVVSNAAVSAVIMMC